jgi:hypothetical protein
MLKAMSRRAGAVINDDVLFGFRPRLFSLAQELGDVRVSGDAARMGARAIPSDLTISRFRSRNN